MWSVLVKGFCYDKSAQWLYPQARMTLKEEGLISQTKYNLTLFTYMHSNAKTPYSTFHPLKDQSIFKFEDEM